MLAKLFLSFYFSFAGTTSMDFSAYNKCLEKTRKSDVNFCFEQVNLNQKKKLEDRFLNAVEGARKHGNPSRKKTLIDDLTTEIASIQLLQDALKKHREELIEVRKRTVVIRVAKKK